MLAIAINPIAKKYIKARMKTDCIKKFIYATPVVKRGSIQRQPNVQIAANAPHQINILI